MFTPFLVKDLCRTSYRRLRDQLERSNHFAVYISPGSNDLKSPEKRLSRIVMMKAKNKTNVQAARFDSKSKAEEAILQNI